MTVAEAESATEKILSSAEQTFAELGFDAAGMKTIASRAGVSQSLLHYHFSNKEHLYAEVVRRRAKIVNGQRRELLSKVDFQSQDALEQVIDAFGSATGLKRNYSSGGTMRVLKSGLALVAALFTSAAIADSYNVTMVAGHPPVFRWVKQMDDPFAPTVTAKLKELGHTINFTGQYGGSIAGVGEELETVEAGLAEIGACSSVFDPAKMPEQNVTYYTPFVSDNPRAVSELLHKLHEDPRMRRSYDDNNLVYIGAPIAIDDYLLMTRFPMTSLDDLRGRKIAAPGPAINWLSGTGAVAVSGNLTTYYNEIKTGVYDGVLVFASAALPGKLHEVAPYVTKMGLGAQFAGAICANKDWYSDLPADVQQALHTGADTAQEWYIGDLEDMVKTAFKVMGENGATITEASDDMRNAWATGMDNAAKTWAEDLDKKGRPGSEILSLYMDAMRATGATPLRDWDKE